MRTEGTTIHNVTLYELGGLTPEREVIEERLRSRRLAGDSPKAELRWLLNWARRSVRQPSLRVGPLLPGHPAYVAVAAVRDIFLGHGR